MGGPWDLFKTAAPGFPEPEPTPAPAAAEPAPWKPFQAPADTFAPKPEADVGNPMSPAPAPTRPRADLLDPDYMDQIKGFEDADLFSGKKTQSQATWDYKQNSNGFGTRARYPGEVIDRDEADRRFDSEIGKARKIVDDFAPDAPKGVKAALTSLTFNSGTEWQTAGLGQAIRAGDYGQARHRFLQYTKAGGQDLQGLIDRRQAESQWWDHPDDGVKSVPANAGPDAGSTDFDPQALLNATPAEQRKILAARIKELTGLDIEAPAAGAQAAPAGGGKPWDAFKPAAKPWEAFKPASGGTAPETKDATPDSPWAFPQGLKGGIIGSNPKMFGDAAEGFGVLLDNQTLKDVGKKVSGYGQGQLDQYKARVPSFTNVRTDSLGNFISDAGAYAGYGAGNALGTSAPSLVTGALGSLATANPMVGVVIGAAAPSYIQNFGDVYGSARDDKDIQARIASGALTEKGMAGTAAVAAVPIAMLDVIGLEKTLGAAFGEAKQGLVKAIVKGMATGAISEGSTEGLQEVISQWAQTYLGSNTPMRDKVVSVIDNALLGGFGGAAMGGASSAGGEAVRALGGAPQAADERKEEPALPPIRPIDPSQVGVAPQTNAEAPGPIPSSETSAPAAAADNTPTRTPAPQVAAPTVVAAPEEAATLKAAGWSDDDIAAMHPTERADALKDAREAGIVPAPAAPTPGPAASLAEDKPSAEPILDLAAQARDLADPQNTREGVYVPKSSLRTLNKDTDKALEVLGSGVPIKNFDGKGGTLIAKSQALADDFIAARDQGLAEQPDQASKDAFMQRLIGIATGAGGGKYQDASIVVQQKDADGAVTRESLVRPDEVDATKAEFEAPGRSVEVLPAADALKRREATVASEAIQQAAANVAEPTEAQAQAGNYKKGHVKLHGLDITIETPQGATRSGVDADGKPWSVEMPAHYGYVKGTLGKDGDHVDVYVGNNTGSKRIFVVDQYDAETGKFDEHKAFVGYDNAQDVRSAYRQAFSDGRADERMGGVTEMSAAEFKTWLGKGRRVKPLSKETPNPASPDEAHDVKERSTETEPANEPDTAEASYEESPAETIANAGEEPAKEAATAEDEDVVFTTAKGSTYVVEGDKTQRTKAARNDIGHEGDSGEKPVSDRTVYVTAENAEKLGEFQAEGGSGKRQLAITPGGKIGVRYLDGKDAGKFEKRTVVPFEDKPRAGLTPVELWKNGTVVHFGNEITKVERIKREPYSGPPLSDDEINLVVDTWRYVRDVEAKGKPESLTAYIVRMGGLEDPNGDVRSLLGRQQDRPGLIRKSGDKGPGLLGQGEGSAKSLDDWAQRAWDAGFFPEHTERPTIAEFLDLLADDLHTGERVRGDDEQTLEDRRVAAEMAEELLSYGITTRRFRKEETVRAYFGQKPEAKPRPVPAGQAEGVEGEQAPFDIEERQPEGVKEPANAKSETETAPARDQEKPAGDTVRAKPDGGHRVFDTEDQVSAALESGELRSLPEREHLCYKFAGHKAFDGKHLFVLAIVQKGQVQHGVAMTTDEKYIYDPQYDAWFEAGLYKQIAQGWIEERRMTGDEVDLFGRTVGKWPSMKMIAKAEAEGLWPVKGEKASRAPESSDTEMADETAVKPTKPKKPEAAAEAEAEGEPDGETVGDDTGDFDDEDGGRPTRTFKQIDEGDLIANLQAATKRNELPFPEHADSMVADKLIQLLKDGKSGRILAAGKKQLESLLEGRRKKAERQAKLDTLPKDLDALTELYVNAAEDLNAAMLKGDKKAVQAAYEQMELLQERANDDTRHGVLTKESPAERLRRSVDVKPGVTPHWGQNGTIEVDVDGIVALVEKDGSGWSLHAKFFDKKFPSNSGFRSARTGMTGEPVGELTMTTEAYARHLLAKAMDDEGRAKMVYPERVFEAIAPEGTFERFTRAIGRGRPIIAAELPKAVKKADLDDLAQRFDESYKKENAKLRSDKHPNHLIVTWDAAGKLSSVPEFPLAGSYLIWTGRFKGRNELYYVENAATLDDPNSKDRNSKLYEREDLEEVEEEADDETPAQGELSFEDKLRDAVIMGEFKTIVQARRFAKDNGFTGTVKEVDEALERAVVRIARDIVERDSRNPKWVYDQLVGVYSRQPNLAVRTGESVSNQAYSTPVPLAYLASRLAGVRTADVVYEPTAGNGALLIEAGPGNDTVYANELDPARAAALKAQGFEVTTEDATTVKSLPERADAVIMNPPFGAVREDGSSKVFKIDGWQTTAIDQAVALKALEQMTPDGRAVLLLGGVKDEADDKRRASYRGQSKREFYQRLYNAYNVVDHFTVAGELYKKQGAGWPVDVIVIAGKRAKGETAALPRPLPAAELPPIYRDWDALAEKLPGVDHANAASNDGRPAQPDRVKAGEADQAVAEPTRGDADGVEPSDAGRAERLPGRTEDEPGRVRGDSDRLQSDDVRSAAVDEGRLQTGARAEPGRAGEPALTRQQRVNAGTAPKAKASETNATGQSTYAPASAQGSLNTLVPVNMAAAARDALDRVEGRHGAVDEFVAQRLGYTKAELADALAAEQIDGVAAAIDNIERGSAVIIGDQTGIGKGRQVAAILRYAMRHDMVPILVTEKPDLYGDMYRDLRDIGIEKMLGRPIRMYMTNGGETVGLDEESLAWKEEAELAKAAGEKIPPRRGMFLSGGSAPRQARDMEAFLAGKPEHDVIFTTYDQLNTVQGKDTTRRQFISAMAPRSLMALDEAHNAGGSGKGAWKSSGKPMDRAALVRDLVAKAKGIVYSSATYAKRPDVMDLYARTDMGRAVEDPSMLPELIQRGGVPMQQIVATMLSSAGQYLRRERSFEGVNYEIVPVSVSADAYSQFTDAIRSVFEFDLAVKPIREDFMEGELDQIGGVQMKDGGVGEAAAHTIAFASVMHNIINQMLLSISAGPTAERAIAAFREGRKPVIGLSNTMESFVSDFAQAEGLEAGQVLDLDFGDVLARYLARTLRITIKIPNPAGEYIKKHIDIPVAKLPGFLQLQYKKALETIRAGDYDALPVSPIDYIRHKLKVAGISVAEVTGRQTMVDYSGGGVGNAPLYTVRPKKEMGPSGKRSSIAAFNRGSLDALIINRSGSTGVSMHASSKFKDQKKRRMILAQAEPNIDTHLQMLGRIHRTGQVELPEYEQVVPEIPASARPTAVLMKKMASLNANTTGARSSVFMADSVDFMNQYGDQVVAEILQEEPELNDRLGGALKFDTEGRPEIEDAARRATGRLVLLSPKEQEEFLDRVTSAYKAEIERLDATGENALEAKTVDLAAKNLETTTLKERTGDTPFLDAVRVEKVSAKAQGRAMAPESVANAVGSILTIPVEGDPATFLRNAEFKGRDAGRKLIQETRQKALSWMDLEAAATKDENRSKVEDKNKAILMRWLGVAQLATPGARVQLKMQTGDLDGIVLALEKTGKTKNPVALGAWSVTVAVPDSARQITFPVSKLFPPGYAKSEDEGGAEIAPSRLDYRELMPKFEEARKEGRETRYILTGNILAGFDQTKGKGRIVNYTTDEGETRPGILMGRDFELQKFMDSRTIRFASGEEVSKFLSSAAGAHVNSTDDIVTLEKTGGLYRIETPAGRATGGRYYTEPGVRDAIKPADFVKSGNKMRVELPDEIRFRRAVDAMRKAGAIFETKEAQEIATAITKASAASKNIAAIGFNTRKLLEKQIKNGETVTIPDATVAQIHEALKVPSRMLPEGTSVATLKRVEPLAPGIVTAVFVDQAGKEQSFTAEWKRFDSLRAFYNPGARGIFFMRFSARSSDVGGLNHSLAAELGHEAVHALFRERLIPSADWQRLVRHGRSLQLLEGQLGTYLKVVGDPAADKANPETTVLDAYNALYEGKPGAKGLLNQEYAAHLVEWHLRGQLLPVEVEPVKEILDDILNGVYAGREAEGLPLGRETAMAALRSDEPAAVQAFWDAAKPLDAALSGEAGRAIDAWVGGPHDAIEMGLTGGLMIPARLESMSESDREAMAQPVRALLRQHFGDFVMAYRGEVKDGGQSTGRQNALFSYTTDRRVAERFAGVRRKAFKIYSEEEIRAAEKTYDETGEVTVGRITYRREPSASGVGFYTDMYDRNGDHITDTDSVRASLESENRERAAENAKRDAALANVRAVILSVDSIVWATDRFNQKELIAKAGAEKGLSDLDSLYAIGGLSLANERPGEIAKAKYEQYDYRREMGYSRVDAALNAGREVREGYQNTRRIMHGNKQVGEVSFELRGDDTVWIKWIDLNGADERASLSDIKSLREAFRKLYPNVKHFVGARISGAKAKAFYDSIEKGGFGVNVQQSVTLADAMPRETQEKLASALEEAIAIVSRIGGRSVQVKFYNELRAEQAASPEYLQQMRDAGYTPGRFAGGSYMRDHLSGEALIALALNFADPAMLTSARHEAWHHVKERLATDAEKRLLAAPGEQARMRALAAAELKSMGHDPSGVNALPDYEIEAYAFQRYARLRDSGLDLSMTPLHIGIRRFFENMLQMLRRVLNVIRHDDFRIFEDIFEAARTGEIAARADAEMRVAPMPLPAAEPFEPAQPDEPQMSFRDRWTAARREAAYPAADEMYAHTFEPYAPPRLSDEDIAALQAANTNEGDGYTRAAEAQQLHRAGASRLSVVTDPAPVDTFFDERVGVNDGGSVSVTTLYEAYSLWAEQRGQMVQDYQAFQRHIADMGIVKQKTPIGVRYVGVVLKNFLDPDFMGGRLANAPPTTSAFDFSPSGGLVRQANIGDTGFSYRVGDDGVVDVDLMATRPEARGKGSARAALSALSDEADARGVTLRLQPMSEFGRDLPRLTDFYKSIGFEPLPDSMSGSVLLRRPRSRTLLANVLPEVGQPPPPTVQSRTMLGRRLSRTMARLQPRLDNLRTYIQDRALQIRRQAVERVEETLGIRVPTHLDTYVAEALYHGRTGERLTDLQTKILEPLIARMRELKIDLDQIGEYLYARHAKERNAAILDIDPDNEAGSGMTDAEADEILDRIGASGDLAKYDELAGMVDAMQKETRDTLLRAGLMDRETLDKWEEKYKTYVPLRGFEMGEEENPDGIRAGHGYDIKGPESMRALGRRSRADNPMFYAVLQAEQAIIRAEKNRVAKTLYRAIQTYPDPAVWEIFKGEARRRINKATGLVETYWVPPAFVRAENVHGVKIGGKQHWMILHHPGLARSMRAVGTEFQRTILGKAMLTLARTYSQLLTSWNPEFVVGNYFRDIETALGNISDVADKPEGVRRQLLKEALSLTSVRAIMKELRNPGQGGEYGRYFEEYRLAGGKISFSEFNDINRIRDKINAALTEGRLKQALRGAVKVIEDLNTSVENGVRLSTYIAMRKHGITQDRAAFVARELTVNFNRKGEWSTFINSMYLFFNASAQGTVRIAQAFSRSRALRIAVGGIFATAMLLDLANALNAGDDDDGENAYDKIADWIKERNIIIMLPGRKDYIMIPMAYGYNVPHFAGQQLMAMLRGKQKPLTAAGNVAAAAFDSFNPVGSAVSFWQFVAPTFLDPGVQMLENKTWYGGPIYPTKFDKKQPDSESYFTNVNPWYVKIAKTLNDYSGGSVGRPGYVDISPETIEHYVEFAGGGTAKFMNNINDFVTRMYDGSEWMPEKTPFLRRLYGKTTSTSHRRDFYEAWDEVDQAHYEVKELLEAKDREGAQQARRDYGAELSVYGQMHAVQKQLGTLKKLRDAAESSDLPHAEKRAKVDEIQNRENALVIQALKSYRAAKEKKPTAQPAEIKEGTGE